MIESDKNLWPSLIADWALVQGFHETEAGFIRRRGDFVDCLSIQTFSDGDKLALNAGTHPIFLLHSDTRALSHPHALSEIDCYIRKRLAPKGETDFWISTKLSRTLLAEKIKTLFDVAGIPFFEHFSSIDFLIENLTVENIASGQLPDCFAMLTKSRLALLGAKANLELGNIAAARMLADYGLSVVGMAVTLKQAFMKILKES